MIEIITKVYTLDELEDPAKEKARDWFKKDGLGSDYEWWDGTYADADTIGLKITSFDVYRVDIEGRLIDDAVTVAKKIIEGHGETCDTYKLAKSFLVEIIPRRTLLGEDSFRADDKYNQAVCSFQKNLLTAYLTMLGNVYQHLSSNEAIDETILSNEYTFTEEGLRFG